MLRNIPWGKIASWLAVLAAYAISTTTMAFGFGAALSYGAEVSGSATTINPQMAWVIGIVLAGIIQWMETEWVLYPNRRSRYDTALVMFLLVFDAGAIFIGLSGHLNLVWMVENGGNTAGMIMHGVALMGQIAGALIGSFGAERLLEKAIASGHINRAQLAQERYFRQQEAS